MKEEVKRLAPTYDTLRQLYTLSGNQCAFPGCFNMMFDMNGNFVGQVCHIEAASEGGERFNPHMTNDQRRHYDNLLLLCYSCHIETNNVHKYPVNVMKKIKQDHEQLSWKWMDSAIKNMYNSFEDVTKTTISKDVTSLSNLYTTVDGQDYRSNDEILDDVRIFNREIKKFIKMSPDAVNLFKIAFERASTDKSKLEWGHGDMLIYFCYEELFRTIRIEQNDYNSILDELIRNYFITYDDDEKMFFIIFPNSESNFWFYMKEYSFKKPVNFDYVFSNFDFTCFD